MASASPRPTRPPKPKLGVLAGGGLLPRRLIETSRAEGRDVFVVAFPGFADPAAVADVAHEWIAPEKTGRILRRFREEGAREIVLAGGMRRPASLLSLRPDARGWVLLLKMLRGWRGDDHVLRQVVKVFEGDGFTVVGAADVASDLLMPAGAVGAVAPGEAGRRDIAVGVRAAREIGRRDRGQAVIVAGGVVVGREAADGTAALLAGASAQGGVLVKAVKPSQERRVDLPSIGPDTVRQAVAAGLSGIALEAGGGLVIDRADVVRAADAAGVFVYGFAPEAT